MDSWSKLIFHRNVSKICLKLAENIKHLSRKNGRETTLFWIQEAKFLANSLFRIFGWSFLCFGGCFSYPGHWLLYFNLRYVRSMHIVACLFPYTIIRLCYNAALTFPIVTFLVTFPSFWIESVFTIYEYPLKLNFLAPRLLRKNLVVHPSLLPINYHCTKMI